MPRHAQEDNPAHVQGRELCNTNIQLKKENGMAIYLGFFLH